MLRIPTHLCSEQAAMTGHNHSPTTAAGALDTVRQVWYPVVVVAFDCAFHVFGVTLA